MMSEQPILRESRRVVPAIIDFPPAVGSTGQPDHAATIDELEFKARQHPPVDPEARATARLSWLWS